MGHTTAAVVAQDAVFDFLDSSSDGQLDPEELADGLHKLGVPQHGVERLFQQLDSQGNGYVTRRAPLTLVTRVLSIVGAGSNFAEGFELTGSTSRNGRNR